MSPVNPRSTPMLNRSRSATKQERHKPSKLCICKHVHCVYVRNYNNDENISSYTEMSRLHVVHAHVTLVSFVADQ